MAITGATNLQPAATRLTLSSNYIDFASGSGVDWTQQYLPDLMEKEAEVFGNRTISGFLSQVGAEEAMTADQVVWSEQGRLHLAYKGHVVGGAATVNVSGTPAGGAIEIDTTIDDVGVATSSVDHGVRVNDILLLAHATSGCARVIVGDVTNDQIDVFPYDATDNDGELAHAFEGADVSNSDTITILVIGSEHSKGTVGPTTANEPGFKSYTNKPIILKDMYHVSGSDASAIGWVEVTGEDGQNGYMWYLKAEGDTRMRFADYCEMSMIESIKGDSDQSYADLAAGPIGASHTTFGTEGLFAAIESRGNVSTGITGVNAATDLAEFDAMLAELDSQGAIEENMMFVNRATALAMDDMLASMNSYGAGGTSYGVFNNSEDMALNLGFSGFRRGSYDFYKSDWKYLNQLDGRGGINAKDAVYGIRGTMVPAGVSSVYDQQLGKNLKRPFLHVRYRSSQTDNRKFKTWITGSVGATTSDLDAMEVNYLSERCLVVQGANNFFLLK